MAVVIVQYPDLISLTGNMKELVIQSENPVGIIMSGPRGKMLEETYYPGNGNLVHIGLREVIEADLSFTLPSSDVFIQPRLSGTYTLSYNSESDTGDIQFTAVRGGKLNLTESAVSFLTGNFLTWQPNSKPVTYYSPEWLTYFAPSACQVRLKAYWEDGTNTIIQVAQLSENSCITINMQYAVVSGKFDGKRPMYYDAWVEDDNGIRLSYVQRYIASERQGENEQWYLFENSLGGLDSLRAYGSIQDVPEYTHHLSGRGDESEEYRVDVNRLHTRNTGYLTPEEARWLQDLFPARHKYMYTLSGLHPIVLTESDGHSDTTDLPSSYTFTYRMANTSPYLDIQRRTDLPENLQIPIPTGETFFLPPRLAEFPKPVLLPNLLIPVEEPHTEVWGATSIGAVHDAILNDLIRKLDGLNINPEQGGGMNIEIIESTDWATTPSDTNVYSALMTDVKIYKAIEDDLQDIDGMYLRKDIPDTAHGSISFKDMAQSTLFTEGYEWGIGWGINNEGLGWFEELKVRDNVYIGKMSGSPSSASGMMGFGTILDMQKASGEFDYLLVRKEFRVNTLVVNETLGLNGNRFVSDFNRIESVQELSDRYRCTIDKIEGMMYMNLRGGDIIRCQQFDGLSSHYYYGEVLGVTEDYFELRKPLLDGQSVPTAGDTVFRAGNDSDPNRQGVIYLATSDTNAPYIDVLDGLTSPDMTDKTKVRLGNISGITSKYKGNLGQLGYHYGIYISGGIFDECDIYMEDGTTVYQSFQIINGKLESEISSIRDAINDNGNNILSNPTWTAGLDKWDYTQDINLFTASNGWLWFNAAFYSDKKSSVEVISDGASRVLRLYRSGITQKNTNLQSRDPGTYVMRIRYKAITPGIMAYGFSGKELYISQPITATADYQEESIKAEWDGTGDFSCTYSGDIFIKSITVISDKLAAIRHEFETKITQTDQSIELLANRVTTTEDGITKAQASISVMADEIALKATKDEFNDLGRKVTANEASIKVNADNISLKVSQTDFDSLGRRVTSAESSIQTNAYNITLKASQSSVNSLTGRISSAESSISVNSQNIASKVSITDYKGSNIVSMINQTADSVKILASKVDIYAYNLNMIRNSGDCKNTVYWKTNGGASSPTLVNGSISTNITIGSIGWGSLVNNSLQGVKLKSGRKYTLRISIYSSVAQNLSVMIGRDSNGLTKGFSLSAGDQERQFTFDGKNVDAEYFRIYTQTTCRIMVNWVKLEEGEYATPWTPNPNDSIYSLDSDLIAALNGTTISGGLQLTTKIKLGLLSDGVWTEQGGISANIDNIMLWAGGTYDQAKAGNVKTILYHDGSLKAEGEFECGSKTGNRCLLSGDGRLRMFRGDHELLNLGYFVESNTYYYPSLNMTRKTSAGTSFGGLTLSPSELLFSSSNGLGCIYGNNIMIFDINKFPTSGSTVGAVYREGNTLKIRTS